jgi:hypothetical protein
MGCKNSRCENNSSSTATSSNVTSNDNCMDHEILSVLSTSSAVCTGSPNDDNILASFDMLKREQEIAVAAAAESISFVTRLLFGQEMTCAEQSASCLLPASVMMSLDESTSVSSSTINIPAAYAEKQFYSTFKKRSNDDKFKFPKSLELLHDDDHCRRAGLSPTLLESKKHTIPADEPKYIKSEVEQDNQLSYLCEAAIIYQASSASGSGELGFIPYIGICCQKGLKAPHDRYNNQPPPNQDSYAAINIKINKNLKVRNNSGYNSSSFY